MNLYFRPFFLLFLLIFVSLSCGEGGCFKADRSGSSVMVEEVRVKESSPSIIIRGKLLPNNRAELSFTNDVPIGDLYVEVGSVVAEGELLFHLADEKIGKDLAVARARQRELELLVEKNNSLLSSREGLVDEGKVDQEEVSRLEREIQKDEAETERVKKEIERYTYIIDNASVNSPISGIVTKKDVNSGGTALAGRTILEIVNINPIVFEFPLNVSMIEAVQDGSQISILVHELPERDFAGQIVYVSPEMNSDNKTVDVRATVPNGENIAKAGMNASAEFEGDVIQKTYIVPVGAVMSKSTRPYVYKVSKGVAHKTPVTIGAVEGGEAEIIKGVEESDLVVVKGGEDLFNGAAVRIWRR